MTSRLRWEAASVAAIFVLLAAGVGLAATPEMIDLGCGGRTVARYMPAANPMKPYIKELFTPSGIQLLLDSPPDHVHHHGLMFAVGAGETEYYGEHPGAGSRVTRFGREAPRPKATKAAPGSVEQTIDWIEPDGRRQLIERRSVRIHSCETGGPNVLTWVTQLKAAEGRGPVDLWGRFYFGLGLRLVADFRDKARFSVPAGSPPLHPVIFGQLRPGNWCSLAGEVGGKPVTIAIWEDPSNPRRALWFTMKEAMRQPIVFLGATLSLPDWDSTDAAKKMMKFDKLAKPLTIQPGKELTLRYGVAVFDGTADAAAIEKARAAWLAAETKK